MAENKGASRKSEAGEAAVLSKVEVHPRKSILDRIRSSISLVGSLFFRSNNDDFEKKLKHLSKEEAAVHTRLKWRSQTWRKIARAVTLYSIIIELLIIGIAIITTRPPELSWQMRAVRVLPVFIFPAVAAMLYSTCASYHRMRERKDQKTLDRLRAERQAKIDELKERTNFYLTQQLIQRYDTDPAAKKAAASVLASKLGAETGLTLAFEPLTQDEAATVLNEGKSHDVEIVRSTGVRKRRAVSSPHSTGQGLGEIPGQNMQETRKNVGIGSFEQELDIEDHKSKASDGGWVTRLAAMLVGEDPTQCYALICRTCHMHNGLAKKEDFQYITYYCPHCHALNGSRQFEEIGERSIGSGLRSPKGVTGDGKQGLLGESEISSTRGVDVTANDSGLMSSTNLVTATEFSQAGRTHSETE